MEGIVEPLELLGQKYNQIKALVDCSEKLEVYDSSESNDDQEYYIASKDGSWEMLFNAEDSVETIFLYMDKGYSEFLGIKQQTSREMVLSILGKPDHAQNTVTKSFMGKQVGCWERYDYENHVLHIQHSAIIDTVEMITIMSPAAARSFV